MRVKVRGGTVQHGDTPLCQTCRFATIVKGQRADEEIVECANLSYPRRVFFSVTSCSDYSDRRRPSLREMEETAWILKSDPTRNRIGFVHASKLRIRDRYVFDDE